MLEATTFGNLQLRLLLGVKEVAGHQLQVELTINFEEAVARV